ncbi:MAG: hypothetical protein ACK2TU_01915 [Anaerolineales bacterium]
MPEGTGALVHEKRGEAPGKARDFALLDPEKNTSTGTRPMFFSG